MNKRNLVNIGRWVAVLPAAASGLFLGSTISNIFFAIQRFFVGGSPDSFWADVNYWLLSAGIASAAAVYFGCRAAPSQRKIVSLILGAILVILVTVSVMGSFYVGEDVAWTIASAVASMFGAGVIIHTFFEEGEKYTFS
jgi:hypothetical protein